jgi:hypothetical protein
MLEPKRKPLDEDSIQVLGINLKRASMHNAEDSSEMKAKARMAKLSWYSVRLAGREVAY